MNASALLAALSTLVLASCASAPPKVPELAGTWKPVKAELGGQDLPVAGFGRAQLVLTADSYAFAGDQGTYTVLSEKPPAKMDILGKEGPNAGHTILAIYALDGDRLSVCYQLGPGERPGALTSPAGSHMLLIHYERAR